MSGVELKTSFAFSTGNREIVSLSSGKEDTPRFATLHHSSTEQPNVAFLLLPGWTGPRSGPSDLLVRLADELSEKEIPVLRLDYFSRGDSTGSAEECDLDTMIADAGLGLLHLKETFKGAKIIVGGICSGANTALGLASLFPKDIQAVCAFSPLPFQRSRSGALDQKRRIRMLKDYAAKALSPKTWARLFRGEVDIGRVKKNISTKDAVNQTGKTNRNLKDSARDIEAELCEWKGQGLFVWGGGDEEGEMSKEHFQDLHQNGMGQTVQFQVIPHANHNFQNREWRKNLIHSTHKFTTSL